MILIYLDNKEVINIKSEYNAVGQFGPYVSKAKGVKFKNFKFKTDEQLKIYGSEYKATVKTNQDNISLTEKSYKEIIEKDFQEISTLSDINNLVITYSSYTTNPNINFESTTDESEKIKIEINDD
mgnify:CR=1 FL=1